MQPFDFKQFSSVTNDSRHVVPGSLFLAYPGDAVDGRKYIAQAVEKGATQIIYDPVGDFQLPNILIPAIPIENLRVKQSSIAAEFYDFPARQLSIIGVTGTNGKTSVTQFIAQATEQRAVIGTMGYGFLPQLKKLKNTTPDGTQLQKIFFDLKKQGAKLIAMEVSSHALAQQRVNDVPFETIVFTNLTQDHLDYHGTMEKYRDAKELLFQAPHVKNAVINIDDDAGVYFSKKYRSQLNVITYAVKNNQADIFVIKQTVRDTGFELTVKTPWGTGTFVLPLLGEFNIANSLAVLGVLGLKGMPFEKILERLSQLKSVAGRMDVLLLQNTPSVVIDYAHTPDALEKILIHTRTRADGKVWCVFGCGGNRDKTKRPKMGAISEKYSDSVIITNDNPRHESGETIAADIIDGVKEKNKFKIMLDRKQAIQEAIIHASKNDWVVIAGKGHETEQIIGDQSIAHDDKKCALHALRRRVKKLSTLAEILDGQLVGGDAAYENISIDSRAITSSDCFFAIKGDKFDGHDFVNGVAMAVVSRKINAKIPQIIVQNTREALLKIAGFYRDTTTIPVAAITGSCGKTTTRALLENILKQSSHVLASQKSFNNDIGVPLTLLQLNDTHDFVVIEMGANHPGEIKTLTHVVKPTVAAITLAAPAHLAGFGSLDGVARAKAEIFDGLGVDGLAVINADDVYENFWKKQNSSRRIVTFGCEHPADVMARDITSTHFTLQLPNQTLLISLPLLGKHNVMNALAAAAMAYAMDVSATDIQIGLNTMKPVAGRLVEKQIANGATIIDDSYNANPTSVRAAIDVLSQRGGRTVLVLGDMMELGDQADPLHAAIGEYALKAGISSVFCYGKHSRYTAEKFGECAQYFEDKEKLIIATKAALTKNTTVLVKGSLSMKMSIVVKSLLETLA